VQAVSTYLAHNRLAGIVDDRLAVVVCRRHQRNDACRDLDRAKAVLDEVGVGFDLAEAVGENEIQIALRTGELSPSRGRRSIIHLNSMAAYLVVSA
jgi:hypothetical protein